MKRIKGFALIEVSIALLVLGIISSISISQFATIKRMQAEMTTKSNVDFILKSLGAYYISKQGLLPYPANNGLQVTGQQVNGKLDFGIIPYKSLGIMEKYAKDGYGNWLLYKLNPDIGKTTIKNRNLGIQEFNSEMKNDRVAFIIKYTINKNENIVWYSENNFARIFANGKIQKNNTPQKQDKTKEQILSSILYNQNNA